jgi:hypothetical protein
MHRITQKPYKKKKKIVSGYWEGKFIAKRQSKSQPKPYIAAQLIKDSEAYAFHTVHI